MQGWATLLATAAAVCAGEFSINLLTAYLQAFFENVILVLRYLQKHCTEGEDGEV